MVDALAAGAPGGVEKRDASPVHERQLVPLHRLRSGAGGRPPRWASKRRRTVKVLQPDNLADALRMLTAADRPPTPIAGGTDLCVCPLPTRMICNCWICRGSRDLPGLRLTPETLELGAATTFWDVINAADAATAFPLLTQAAHFVGAIQIQARGTWAGNIANGSPAADGVLALLVYDRGWNCGRSMECVRCRWTPTSPDTSGASGDRTNSSPPFASRGSATSSSGWPRSARVGHRRSPRSASPWRQRRGLRARGEQRRAVRLSLPRIRRHSTPEGPSRALRKSRRCSRRTCRRSTTCDRPPGTAGGARLAGVSTGWPS